MRTKLKSALVAVLIWLPVSLSGPLSAVIRRVWKGFRDA